ncbi:hypothetical protein [Celerinatantimonas yamalensis]|uniref:Uncharacterized protein n=1 Tax=Celerinatantimonas yamalensis TaxID=559956 RepID=A0ABW9G173_9GAMM
MWRLLADYPPARAGSGCGSEENGDPPASDTLDGVLGRDGSPNASAQPG